MKVKDVINCCLVKLGYDFQITEGGTLTNEQTAIVNKLMKCVENVHSELITAHFPNVVVESVNLQNGKLQYSSLTNKIVYPIALKKGDEVKKIKVYPTYIESDFSGKGTFEFCAMLTTYAQTTELNDTVPTSVLADGVVAEYAYSSNLNDMGVQHERKYLDNVSRLKSHAVSSKIIKPRRWE